MDDKTYQIALEMRDRLRAELERNEIYLALQHAEAIVAMWPHRAAEQTIGAQKRPSAAVPRHIAGSQNSRIVDASVDYLRKKGSRAKSGEVLEELTRMGIEVRGKDKLRSLSSALSHSPLFDNVLGQGYGLKEWSDCEAPKVHTIKSGDDSQGARWCRAAQDYLLEKGSRAASSEIYANLSRKGIIPAGDNVANILSSYLSQAKDVFDNIRGQGYGLCEWSRSGEAEALDSGELSSASKPNGEMPMNLF